MKKLLLIVLLVSSCMTPAYAQAESDPFELAHPVTGEPGVWIPPWVQKLHLETDAKLHTCTETLTLKDQQLAEKNAEISSRIAATEDVRSALGHTQVQLMVESSKLRAAEAASEKRLIWAWVATGGALIAGVVLAVDAVF